MKNNMLETAGNRALFAGAVLFPLGALGIEIVTHLCARVVGFDPIATPLHFMMVAFVCASLLMLWRIVRGKTHIPVRWYRIMAVGHGVALVFSALFVLLTMIYILAQISPSTFLIVLIYSLIPPLILVHTPLFALMSGVVLLRRFNRMAKQQGVLILKSLSAGMTIGLVVAFTFYAAEMDADMVADALPSSLAACFAGQHYECRLAFSFGEGTLSCKDIVHRGDARYQFHRGEMYVGKNTPKAVKWLRKAAKNGHPLAKDLVDRHERDGTTTSRDVAKEGRH